MLYNITPCYGKIPFDKKINFFNLYLLGLDLTEKQIFDFRFNETLLEEKYVHANRYNKKLKKIGFISRDFANSRPSGQLSNEFFSYLGEELKKFGIELYFYSFRGKTSNDFKSYATLRENRTVFNLADMIYADEIDILFDMQGHMHNNFNACLNLKPAPIIVHWLGYPGTMGLKCIDYHIADKTIIPDESIIYYREKIAYLDHCYQINNTKYIVETSKFTRKELGYPEDKFIFCSFNDYYKLDKKTWSIWMEILKKSPNSILLHWPKTESYRTLLLNEAKSYGVNENQIIMANRLPRYDHINRLSILNCGLDTYYCNGHTTSSDLIAAGIPVITYPGETYHSRVTKSILLSLDLPELISNSWDDYIEKAVRLSNDKNYFENIKLKIKNNRNKILFNSKQYTINFVNLTHNIWKNHYGTDLPEGCFDMEVTKFGHHIKNQNYKWIFLKNKTINCKISETKDLRYQELRDYADLKPECKAFTTDGKIVIDQNFNLENTIDWIDCKTDEGTWIKTII